MEGAKKRGRHRTVWTTESEEDLSIMGIKNRQALVKDQQQWRMVVLEVKTHNRR